MEMRPSSSSSQPPAAPSRHFTRQVPVRHSVDVCVAGGGPAGVAAAVAAAREGASIRVMPCCFVTGQTAGVAAAMAAPGGDARALETDELRRRLRRLGADLPETVGKTSKKELAP